ncbi:MAG: sugar transferase, partial [Acutalibacteraceae bacterium]
EKFLKGVCSMYTRFFKRVIDIVLSVIGIIICLIPMIITAIAIKIDSPGPVLFRQKRIGYKGKVFEIYKFRSMCQGAEHTGTGVYSGADDMRVTRVGKIIRATSIDELPQLFNIIKGDMSFIGPRPPLTYHPWPIEEYTEEQLHMFDAHPGITGWAQVNGRKGVEWHKRIELNCWYVDNMSLWLDIKILFTTFFKVIKNEDNVNVGATLVTDKTEEKEFETV